MAASTTDHCPPPPRRRARAHGRPLAYGGNGVARREEGYVVFVAGARARRPRARRGRQGQEGVRRGARRRDRRALARPHPARSPTIPARRGRCCPTSASSRSRRSRSRTRCAASAGSRASSSSRSSPPIEEWRYRNKLEYSFGTGDDGELVCGFHAPGRWDEIVADGRLQARVRARATTLREQALASCAARASAPGTAAPARLPAQPRRPRGPPHRRDAGAAGHLARQAGRRRASSTPSTPTACCGPRPPASARAPTAARRRCSRGAPQLVEQLGDLAS